VIGCYAMNPNLYRLRPHFLYIAYDVAYGMHFNTYITSIAMDLGICEGSVQDGMAIAHGTIDKIHDLVRHIISSPSHIQAFNEIAEREIYASDEYCFLYHHGFM
ncbi:hypothetical protein ACJX0J_027733, partial [Zea mays]